MTKTLVTAAAGLLLAGKLLAHDLTLVWTASPDTNVNGYKVVYSEMGSPITNFVTVGLTNLVTITNLISNTNIQYQFTCYAVAGTNQSEPSLAVVTVIPPHSVKRPRFVGRTGSAFTLTWDAHDEADAKTYKVTYGTVSPLTTNVVLVPVPTTSVTVTTGLVVGALHYFDFTVINNPGVESWPKQQLRDTLLPPGPADLKAAVLVN